MSDAYEDIGAHGRFVPQPDGLDRRCKVCGAEPGKYCTNLWTKEPRRLKVSCAKRGKP